ncbi:holo-ACP synthase [Leptospira venezuelensis]|uniref:Holo-[acyl-carrier-protein] synthase n=4 Tax=Leptospira TaxID=171 RepID=A0A4R9FX44_9LEPT|nr:MULTISPECIES: holo-ACP synthase [Leptospira]PJZ49799.1 holo-[acyl-carrier-protein] synthase [Leptospira saintgironsiae]TGK03404.1 holo-[acyl-carrier-protein] synthase [Leptospira selangorensis]TGL59258.1 holo-[acyl-carrier-protein] synthase [Leptospira sarikeiensis]TGM10828.1 holo-[acyl-carrier-protein] synthase [Leptospira selangorensis]TGM26863.1 holo-[acyl-carrier-protein] synthase [Leptospira selangorensis]
MKITIGNDIVENSRIRDLLDKHGERFLKRVFSETEIAYCSGRKDPVPHLSGRFCVKEAFIKAIEPGDKVILDMREIELFGKDFGKKELVLHGKSKELFLEKGYSGVSVSISHAENYSTAVVVLYKE